MGRGLSQQPQPSCAGIADFAAIILATHTRSSASESVRETGPSDESRVRTACLSERPVPEAFLGAGCKRAGGYGRIRPLIHPGGTAMKLQRLLVALTFANLGLFVFLLTRVRADNSGALPVLRG